MVSGPDPEVEQLWKTLLAGKGGKYPSGDPEVVHDFLGCDIHKHGNTVELSMPDYCREIVATFKRMFPDAKRVTQVQVPMLDVLEHDAEKCEPARRVQKLIGMILWLARNVRPDIAYCVSRLGTRVTKWDAKATLELARVVGYLENTATHGIRMTMGDSIENCHLVAYSDANLSAPASQSGCIFGIEGEGTWIPLIWKSKPT
jgi:hypothetical protein